MEENANAIYDNESEKLLKWMKKFKALGNSYDDCIIELCKYKLSDNKTESKLYDIFVYCSDEVWHKIRKEVDENYG